METWLLFIILEVNALDAFLKERPRKYRYSPYEISLKDVLFLLKGIRENNTIFLAIYFS